MFDGRAVFTRGFFVVLGGAILAWPVAGLWGLAGVAVAVYYFLKFCNAYERRDISDAAKPKKGRRHPR